MVISNPIPIIHCSDIFILLMRISKVTTKGGDGGQTGLSDGTRVSKSNVRIHALGSVDYLNTIMGWVVTCSNDDIKKNLNCIQQDLFNLGGELSDPRNKIALLKKTRINWLSNEVSRLNDSLPPLKEFIIPGGTELISRLQIARSTTRNVERDVVTLSEMEPIPDTHIPYLNRLSDYLFVLARSESAKNNETEIQWQH